MPKSGCFSVHYVPLPAYGLLLLLLQRLLFPKSDSQSIHNHSRGLIWNLCSQAHCWFKLPECRPGLRLLEALQSKVIKWVQFLERPSLLCCSPSTSLLCHCTFSDVECRSLLSLKSSIFNFLPNTSCHYFQTHLCREAGLCQSALFLPAVWAEHCSRPPLPSWTRTWSWFQQPGKTHQQAACYQLNARIPPKFLCWYLIPWWLIPDGIWMGSLWDMIRL